MGRWCGRTERRAGLHLNDEVVGTRFVQFQQDHGGVGRLDAVEDAQRRQEGGQRHVVRRVHEQFAAGRWRRQRRRRWSRRRRRRRPADPTRHLIGHFLDQRTCNAQSSSNQLFVSLDLLPRSIASVLTMLSDTILLKRRNYIRDITTWYDLWKTVSLFRQIVKRVLEKRSRSEIIHSLGILFKRRNNKDIRVQRS